jgi:hypothetical protein
VVLRTRALGPQVTGGVRGGQALAVLQELVEEFMRGGNRLKQHCPQINVMHTTLHLVDAWRWCVSPLYRTRNRYVPGHYV